MRFIKHENGKKYLFGIIAKFVGGWIFFFTFLIVILPWVKDSSLPDLIAEAIAPVGAGLIVWGLFGPFMQFAQYHAWPAIKLTDDTLFVKPQKSFNLQSFSYSEVTDIQEIQTNNGNSKLFSLRLSFFNGSEWETMHLDENALPGLKQLSEFLSKKSNLQTSSRFEE